jgi:FtsH-binding integral membrane protein
MAKITIDDDAVAGMDADGDGHITKAEMDMHLEFKRKALEDQDAQRDAMRKMTWFALMGMLLYPFAIVLTSFLGLPEAANIVGDIAPTYFVAIAALVAAFFGADAIKNKN